MNTRLLTAFMAVALAAPIAALGQKPSDTPASTTTESALERLNPTHRKMVEQQAPFYRRFPDGSLWTRKVEADRDALPAKNAKREAFDKHAPLWYCPATDSIAESEQAIFGALDAKDIAEQLGYDSLYVLKGYVLYVKRDSVLVDAGGDELLLFAITGATANVSEGDELLPFGAKLSKRVDYTIPERMPQLFRRNSSTLAKARGTPGGSGESRVGSDHIYVRIATEMPLPKSRLSHTTSPVTSESIAQSLLSGGTPSLVEWTPRKIQVWVKDKSEKAGGHYEDEWKLVKTETKPTFKPAP